MTTKARKTGKRSLALFMTVLMLMSAWVFVAPTASAATAGSYYVKITGSMKGGKWDLGWLGSITSSNLNNTFTASWGNTTNDSAGMVIRYKTNNGTGSGSTDQTVDLHTWGNPMPTGSEASKTANATVPGFPVGFYFCLDQNDSATHSTIMKITKIEVGSSASNLTTIWTGTITLNSSNQTKKVYLYQSSTYGNDTGSSDGNQKIENSNKTWTMPYANSITDISGDSTVYVATNDTTVTKTYTLGTVKDQYGVNWYQDASWDTATVQNGVSFSSGTLTVPSSSNRSSNYTVTLKEKCGNASSTKTVTIGTFDYKVTFYDENGTTVLKATQTIDYGGSATPPSDPTKAYDDNKHYTFAAWTGDGYTNIKTGAQTKTVKASYTGTNHNYNQQVTTSTYLKSAATCENKAVYYYSCTCGKKGTTTFETGNALGHDYTGAVHSLNNGTHNWACTKGCGTYGKVDSGTQVKNGYVSCTYGNWTADTATCESAGSHSRTCSACGHTDTQTTPSLGHNYTAQTVGANYLYKSATCTEAAKYYYSCSRCGKSENDPNHTFSNGNPLGHSFTGAARNAGTGVHNYQCARCDVYGVGTTPNATEACSGGTATCAAKAVCDVCHTEYGDKAPNAHTNLTHTARVENTCLNAGNIEYWYCSGCGKYFSDAAATAEITQAATILAKKDHSYTGAVQCNNNGTHSFKCVNGCDQFGGTVSCEETYGQPVIDPTPNCTTEGISTRTCSVCGYDEVTNLGVDANAHNWGAWTQTNAPTCTQTGLKVRECSRCHKQDTETVPVLGHDWNAEFTVDTQPTCTAAGQKSIHCARCGEKKDVTVIQALGHDWGEWERTLEPGCETKGEDTRTCARCGATETRDVNPLTHNWETEWTTDVEPGCTTAGSKSHHCARCGAKNDVTPIDPLGHDWGAWSTKTPATCLAAGVKEHTCNRCSLTEEGSIEKLEHSYTGAVKDNTDGTHSFKCVNGCDLYGGTVSCEATYGDWSTDTATCTVQGEQYRECSVCHHVDSKVTPLKPHDYTVQTVNADRLAYPANCTQPAKYYYSCSMCGESENNSGHLFEDGEPLGHDWTGAPTYIWMNNNHVVRATLVCKRDGAHIITEDVETTVSTTKAPTCTETGIATYTATFTNDPTKNDYNYTTQFTTQTTTSEVDMLPHTYEYHDPVMATCTDTGMQEYWTCSVCHQNFYRVNGEADLRVLDDLSALVTPIDPTTHIWGEWSTDDSSKHVRYCERDNSHYEEAAHTWVDIFDESLIVPGGSNDPCTGLVQCYQTCEVCGRTNDAAHVFTVSEGDGHSLVHHEAKLATCTTAGNSEYWECENCGKYFSDAEGTTQITNKNDVIIQPSGHDWDPTTITYVWSDDYSKVTATMKCRNDESHVMVRVSNTTAEATNANCTTPGTTTYTAVFTEPFATQTKAVNNIASLGHMLTKTPAKAATCMETGNIEYWTCSRCSKVFTDGTAQSEITDLSTLTIPIAPNNHAVLTHVPEAPATCTNDGTAEHWICNDCHGLFVYEGTALVTKTAEDLVIPAHHTFTLHVAAKAPTCLAEGNQEYWQCSACDKLFAADKTTELPTAVLSATGHSFSTVAAVEATCEEAGHEAYKKCNNCGLFFDTAATVTTTADNAIDPSDMVTDPIGHDYSARPTFVWNGHTAKATFVCQNDSSHTEEVDCVVTKTATAPHCDTPGEDVYTAHASYDGHDWTEASAPETVPATGHSFTGSVKDNGNGTHSFQCVNGCEQYGTDEDGVGGSASCEFREDGWVIGENESCLTVGTESQYCAVCGHKAERERIALGHNFTAVAAVEETCTEDGNTAYWVCTRCGEFFSSNEHPTSDADKIADKSTVVIPASGHDWGEPTFVWTGYTAATATFVCQNDESHEETVICTVSKTPGTPGCEQGATNVYTATAVFDGHSYTDVKREDISQTNHNWGTPVYVWSEDLSTCTATVTCLNDANHKKTETVNTVESISVQPTCTEEGLAVYTASFTNPLFTQQKEYKTLAATGHPENSVHKYEQDPTCTEDGYEAYWKCDVCGKMYDSATLDHEIVAPTSIPASGHDWGEPTYEWAEDNSSVTATKICGNDGSHVETVTVNTTSAVTTPATCEGKGKTTYTATFTTPFATQTKVLENVDALGHDFSPSKDRVHDLDGDNSHHNYACANGCGAYGVGIGNAATVGGVVECAFGDWIISNNESCTEAGSEWRQCAYCSNKETHPRAALPHTEVEVEAKDATCIADGNKAYTYCSVCGTILSVGGTPETSGVKVYDAAGKELIKTTTKLGHDLTKTDAVAPTCEIAGNIDYWTCSRCGKIFNVEEPAEDTDPITLADIVDPAIGHDYSAAADRIHSLNNGTHNWACANGCGTYGVMENSIPVKNGTVACTGDPATCTQDAHCTVCGGVFTSALGHDYRLQSWTWNGVEAATANFVCSRDSSHTHQETAVITTEPATVTCTEPGKMVYFATVHFENGIYTDKKSVIVPALGHDWDFEHPVYDWDQTKQQCTVTLKCLNDGCTAEYTEIGYNETQTTAATCENAGSVVYTAHFNISETLVSPSITVTLEALGHKWGDPDWHWAEDFSSATVTLTCGRAGCGKVETVNATVTPDTVAPTCEKDGRTVYTATATLDGRTYKDTKLTTQPASGHAWPDQPAFSWTGSDAAGWTAATATFACANNAEHDQTLTCAVTHVTEDPTCEGSGKTTYTATVTFNGNTYTDQKEVTINPTGHSYEFVDFNWSYNESTKVWSATVANFKCANDPTHTATAEATVTSETVEAICEADGSITYTAKVTFEGQEYTDTKVVVLPMLHHNWGDATYTWVKDGDQYKVTALRVCANKPTEHQQTETVTTTSEITSSSGCETQGVRTYTATFHTPFTTQTRTEDVAVAGHMLVHTSRVESTCTAAGNIEYWRCSVCNKIFTDEAGTAASCIGTDLAETVIPATGHTAAAAVEEDRVEPTCTETGSYNAVVYCAVCGDKLSTTPQTLPALGHSIWHHEAKAATCTTVGWDAYDTCRRCSYTTYEEIAALGHDFTGAIHDNNDGTHSFKCSRCSTYGAVIDGVSTALADGGRIAHTFDQQVLTRTYLCSYADCYNPIKYYYSCTCGAKGTGTFTPEGSEALGHNWVHYPPQAETCTQVGHTEYDECSRCHEQRGYAIVDEFVGHGAYQPDSSKSGASADGSIKWDAYSCERGCGDYFMVTTITSLDANGTRVPNVNVRIVDSAGRTVVNGKTDGNGELKIGSSNDYGGSLHPGRYDIYLEYVRDGSNYNTHGTVTFADGKVSGSYGKLTPYGGNASGSLGGKPTSEFRCSMCDLNDSAKNKPVYGWFISIIHAFVHAISRITSR